MITAFIHTKVSTDKYACRSPDKARLTRSAQTRSAQTKSAQTKSAQTKSAKTGRIETLAVVPHGYKPVGNPALWPERRRQAPNGNPTRPLDLRPARPRPTEVKPTVVLKPAITQPSPVPNPRRKLEGASLGEVDDIYAPPLHTNSRLYAAAFLALSLAAATWVLLFG